jgi:RNA polymerase sigma-70 factor (ECF subfamily)
MATPRRGTSLTLLERVRANDADAWRRMVDLYSPLVAYWCGRWGVRGEDADDVMQEVFQATSTSLKDFRREQAGDTFRGWLRGITRNMVLLHFRRSGQHPKARGGTDALVQLQQVAEGILPDEEDPPAEISGLYQRALDLVRCEFEAKTWQMFWETVVHGRSPVDLAKEFGVTPATVRKAKSRVLRRLKEEVGDLILC